MKKLHKILATVVSVAALAAVSVAVAACNSGGSGSAASLTAIYNSNKKISYSNMAPQYNYRICTITYQTIETYDDDTYCITQIEVQYSNLTAGESVPSGEFTANEQGSSVIKYYGSFTVVEADEDTMSIALGTPTRYVYSSKGSAYIDTAVWSEAMEATTESEDRETGETTTQTAAEYLESKIGAWKNGDIEVFIILTESSYGTQISGLTGGGGSSGS